MNNHGKLVHDSNCREPLNEHTGNEPCLQWVEPEEAVAEVVAHYTQGPQGNQVSDYRADFLHRYGNEPIKLVSSVEDRRDNRDPVLVGMEFLSRSNGQTYAA